MKKIAKYVKSVAHYPLSFSSKNSSNKARSKVNHDSFDNNISAPMPKYSYQRTKQSDGLLDADFGACEETHTKAMRRGEYERDQGNNVVYLSPEQRDNYELRPHDGLLFRKDGIVPVDTKLFYGNRSLLYVISPDKKIYSGRGAKYIMHHSSFLAGGDVLAAGKLIVADGKVILVSNNSGHYRPSARYLLQAIQLFHELGVLSPHALIDFRHHGKLGLKEGIEVLNNAILAEQNLAIGEGQCNSNAQA
jgi:hypothetical protein